MLRTEIRKEPHIAENAMSGAVPVKPYGEAIVRLSDRSLPSLFPFLPEAGVRSPRW